MPQNDQVSVRDFQALERRVTELERRMDRNVADINKSLQSAKGSDDSLIRRLEKIERTTNDNDKTSTRLDKIDDRMTTLQLDVTKLLTLTGASSVASGRGRRRCAPSRMRASGLRRRSSAGGGSVGLASCGI